MIFEVMIEVFKDGDVVVFEIMIFLVSVKCEVELVKMCIDVVVVVVCMEYSDVFEFKLGVMVEMLWVVLCVEEIVLNCYFFSFGINDFM